MCASHPFLHPRALPLPLPLTSSPQLCTFHPLLHPQVPPLGSSLTLSPPLLIWCNYHPFLYPQALPPPSPPLLTLYTPSCTLKRFLFPHPSPQNVRLSPLLAPSSASSSLTSHPLSSILTPSCTLKRLLFPHPLFSHFAPLTPTSTSSTSSSLTLSPPLLTWCNSHPFLYPQAPPHSPPLLSLRS